MVTISSMASFVPVVPVRHSVGKCAVVCAPCVRRSDVARPVRHCRVRAALEEKDYTETTLIKETEALDESSGSTIVPASYALPGAFLTVAIAMRWLEVPAVWIPCAVLGVFLSIQASVVRIVFGPKRLSVARKSADGLQIIRGWAYEEFAHWEVWWPKAAVLCYFRERESYGGRGSIHFFPIVCNGMVLEQMLREKVGDVKE